MFNTDTQVTDNGKGLLDGRRLAEYAHSLPRSRGNVGVTQRLGRARLLGRVDGRRLAEYAHSLPRSRGNVGVTQRLGRARLLGRVSYYGGWYDYDSGHGEIFAPSGGLPQGFFDGRPIVDLELSLGLGRGTSLAVGAQNVFDTYSQVSAVAMLVGERYSEYTPWGYSGAYYYVRIGYDWGG